MNSIRIKKGYHLNIAGTPQAQIAELPRPARVAALPERIPFIKPRLLVQEGDAVAVGSPLFEDKRFPQVKFLSPGGGRVETVDFGPRRTIRAIVIVLDPSERRETFEALSAGDLTGMARDRLTALLMARGVWPLLRALPFRDFPAPDAVPPKIFVSMDAKEPFQPRPEVYLQGGIEAFRFGLQILHRLSEGRVVVTTSPDNRFVMEQCRGLLSHVIEGRYPADDPGVLLYRTKGAASENRSWYINGQDLLQLAHSMGGGIYATERVVALGGHLAENPMHYRTRLGIPLAHLAPKGQNGGARQRYLVGGICKGYSSDADGYLGLLETALILIPEGREREPLAFVRPGFTKPSYSRAFLSFFNRAELAVDCNRHGGLRACIGCGYCVRVCPVDILPQLAYKSILAGEVEEALSHGLLDCVECGLCSYVCPSKIELFAALKQAKADYYREQG